MRHVDPKTHRKTLYLEEKIQSLESEIERLKAKCEEERDLRETTDHFSAIEESKRCSTCKWMGEERFCDPPGRNLPAYIINHPESNAIARYFIRFPDNHYCSMWKEEK